MTLKAAIIAVTAALAIAPLTGCATAVTAALEDRSAANIATDARIKGELLAEVVDKMGKEVISINADVYEQDVMLTGAVEDPAIKAKAETLTRTVSGVKKIHNMMIVRPAVTKEKGAVEGFVDDSVIETKIKVLLIDAEGVSATNYRYRSVEGAVFLFGRALSQAELIKAVALIKTVKNVKSLTNLVKVVPLAK